MSAEIWSLFFNRVSGGMLWHGISLFTSSTGTWQTGFTLLLDFTTVTQYLGRTHLTIWVTVSFASAEAARVVLHPEGLVLGSHLL